MVTLNTRRDGALADEYEKTRLARHDLGAKRMLDFTAWRRFTKLLHEERIDLIHAQDQDTIIYAGLANRLLGYPAIMSRHVLYEPSDTARRKIRAKLVLWAAKVGFNKIIAVSEETGRKLVRLTSVAPEKVVVIHNGIPTDRFNVEELKDSLRARFGWDQETAIVIMIAALRPGKGHEVLIEAIPSIIDNIPNIRFVFVGVGRQSEKIKALSNPYKKVVEFLGERTDIPELLTASDVLLLPSWAEALPTVLLEAGAASLPAVATDVGGTKEIIDDGETGYIIPPGDSVLLAERLVKLLNNKSLAQKMGNKACNRIMSTFSLQKQAKKTVALYQEVLDQ